MNSTLSTSSVSASIAQGLAELAAMRDALFLELDQEEALNAAGAEGYEAGATGQARSRNPHPAGALRDAWDAQHVQGAQVRREIANGG
jgi:ribosome modulation factor